MPTFIDMSNLTKRSTLTGNEEFQVSATEKVTSQQIADLAPAKGVKQVVVTDFRTNAWTLSDGGSVSFLSDIKDGEIVTFTSAKDATNGPGVVLFGYAIKQSSLMASYVGMTASNKVRGIPTIYTYKSAGVYATAWQQLPDASVKTVEITDFAIPGLNITKDGESFLFYANDASNIPNNNHGATSFVGVAIASPIFITGHQRLLYYMMVDTARGMFYTGYANLEDYVVAWNDTPVTRLGQAVQVTAFTEGALSSLLYTFKAGDFIPFYTGNVTASTANQFPESGAFNGFISMGSNEGDYFQIFAFKTGSPNAYIGACIGSTTRWTQIGGGSSNLIVVADAENVGEVVAAYKGFEGSNKYGVSVPIYIEATSNIYDELPAIMDQSFTKDESTICGYAQYVYDGGDYYYIGLSLLIYPSSGDRPKYRAELVVNNSGEVVSSSLTPIGSAHAPIPGFTKITSLAGQTDYSLKKGSMGVINFSTEVNANTIMFIEAEVRSSAAISADVRSVCIPVSFFNPKEGATLVDLNTRTLTSGTNIAQVRLNVASVVTGAKGVQGLTCVVTSNNIANPSDILRIKAVYANI